MKTLQKVRVDHKCAKYNAYFERLTGESRCYIMEKQGKLTDKLFVFADIPKGYEQDLEHFMLIMCDV